MQPAEVKPKRRPRQRGQDWACGALSVFKRLFFYVITTQTAAKMNAVSVLPCASTQAAGWLQAAGTRGIGLSISVSLLQVFGSRGAFAVARPAVRPVVAAAVSGQAIIDAVCLCQLSSGRHEGRAFAASRMPCHRSAPHSIHAVRCTISSQMLCFLIAARAAVRGGGGGQAEDSQGARRCCGCAARKCRGG